MGTNPLSDQPLASPSVIENKRPLLVTVLCGIGFVGALFSLFGVLLNLFAPVSERIILPSWYIIFAIVWIVLYFASLTFIWKMKKSD